MEAEGLDRTLTDTGSGARFHAPTGTYSGNFLSNDEAFDAAERAAFLIDPSAEIVLMGGGPILFRNCRPVQEEFQFVELFAGGRPLYDQVNPRFAIPRSRTDRADDNDDSWLQAAMGILGNN
jgi:hypothetical protein